MRDEGSEKRRKQGWKRGSVVKKTGREEEEVHHKVGEINIR